jgi:hypothetical protein
MDCAFWAAVAAECCWFIHSHSATHGRAILNALLCLLLLLLLLLSPLQKNDVEVFFEDVEQPPQLPRNNTLQL